MTLANLTTEQVYILNVLWSIETMEDIVVWQAMLPVRQQRMVDTLIELLKLEGLEEDLARSDLADAVDVLEKYRDAK